MSASLFRKLRQAQNRLQAGDAPGAHFLCEQVLRAAPRNADALYLNAQAQLSLGHVQEAVELLNKTIIAAPRNGAALENLGVAQLMLGRFGDAEQSLAQAAKLPNAPASVFMRLGVALFEQGRSAHAMTALRRALTMDPHDAITHLNLGRALAETGESSRAREHFLRALELMPQCADAAFNLGVLAAQQNDYSHAREHYLHALHIAPDFMRAHEVLATACINLGRAAEAIPHLRAIIAADNKDALAVSALAQALFEVGHLDEAEASARRAIELNPLDVAAYATAANRHVVGGEFERAIELLEAGYAHTKSSSLLGNLCFQLRQVCDWSKWRAAWEDLQTHLAEGAAVGSPFWLLCEPTTPEQQLAYARRWATARFASFSQSAPVARATRQRGPRLRIGYLSSDLHQHATAYLIADVLEHHDRERFEVFAYSYGPDDGSPMRARLRDACEHFIDIAHEADDSAARCIRADALDILIDLKGYTAGDRLTIMAQRPCAIQATWLGYPGTLGAPFIDYLFADPFVIPPDAEPAYSERIVRLPHCYQPNDRKRVVAPRRDRAEYGLPETAFVYCCFNQTYKITPEIFAVWMRLLHAQPNAVLWLYESNAFAKAHLLQHARAAGVPQERIVFAPRLPNAEHLARYRAADLALDTYPYTSHTTLSDALWCGCPAVALCGKTFAARVSGSLLSAAGLTELLTHSLADYEWLCGRLAVDTELCATFRTRVAHARDHSPLFDSAGFILALEELYRSLVTRGAVQ